MHSIHPLMFVHAQPVSMNCDTCLSVGSFFVYQVLCSQRCGLDFPSKVKLYTLLGDKINTKI